MRVKLESMPLQEALKLLEGNGGKIITMSKDQWDNALRIAYEANWVLLELDDHERPVAAYRKTLSNR